MHDYDENINTMEAFFRGKLKLEDSLKAKNKVVELGHGKGIEHLYGSYSQYIKKLSEQSTKGNGIIYLGKYVTEQEPELKHVLKSKLESKLKSNLSNQDVFSISDSTDKFTSEEIPKVLIMFYNILNEISIKLTWKDSDNDTILEQYYEIPSAYSMQYDWWDQYGVYFIGPENLEEGNYIIEVTSTSYSADNKRITLTTSLEFTVIDAEEK